MKNQKTNTTIDNLIDELKAELLISARQEASYYDDLQAEDEGFYQAELAQYDDISGASIAINALKKIMPHYPIIEAEISKVATSYARETTALLDIGSISGSFLRDTQKNVFNHAICRGYDITPIMDESNFQNDYRLSDKDITIDSNHPPLRLVDTNPHAVPLQELIRQTMNGVGSFGPISVAVMLRSFQLIKKEYRTKFLSKLHNTMVPGGVAIFIEKVLPNPAILPDMSSRAENVDLFVRGYDEHEINRCNKFYENDRIPFTLEHFMKELHLFDKSEIIFKYYNHIVVTSFKK